MSEEENAASVDTSNQPAEQSQIAGNVNETENVNDQPIDVEANRPSLKDRLNEVANKSDEKKRREGEEETKHPSNGDQKASEGELKIAEEQSHAEPLKFEPNWKYKAFGKEKELDEFWRPLVKDAESEKRVKEIFTRADAFDDMKQRYEASSQTGQQNLMKFNELEKDVRKVTGYLKRGDYDNFFQSVGLSDDQILQYLQQKADVSRMGPEQQMMYNRSVQERAQNAYNQEQYAEMNQMMASQKSELRRMELDHALIRPEVSSVANAYDQEMGPGQFRQLVIDEAINAHARSGQDLNGSDAVQNVLSKFGKVFERLSQQSPSTPQPQALAQPAAPQAPQVVNVQGRPVIPNVQGRGTSPVRQKPQRLSDLRKLGAEERRLNMQVQEANI